MIRKLQNKSNAVAANACGDVCYPEGSYFQRTDFEGFWYPEVDKNKSYQFVGFVKRSAPYLPL